LKLVLVKTSMPLRMNRTMLTTPKIFGTRSRARRTELITSKSLRATVDPMIHMPARRVRVLNDPEVDERKPPKVFTKERPSGGGVFVNGFSIAQGWGSVKRGRRTAGPPIDARKAM
jgi:hypothetical protein